MGTTTTITAVTDTIIITAIINWECSSP